MDPSGYSFERVSEDGEFVLLRGRLEGEPRSVLLLMPASDHPSPASIGRLNHAYGLRNELDPAWAARPLDLADYQGRHALVLEDTGGDSLARLIGRPLDIEQFLRTASGIVKALGRFHARGLIHRDVRPANILVNPAAGGAWLTGFGLTSRLPREHQSPEAPDVIGGTLEYMAPEQTGRMNRSIDSRSDLYSLGVTLYEMLVGALPFTASDPMEWVHCHLARQARSPRERISDIPEPISGIVMKLLSKTAEDRYQTAAGLEADLRRCFTEWEARGQIDPFPLGTTDMSDKLLIPERLYGREREIELLLAAFDRVATRGTTEFVLVAGYAGVGKSSVVNELHKGLVPSRGLFASGKFDQYKRDVPYATLSQAFQHLTRQILGQSEEELGHWRAAIHDALGANGQLMVNLIPELELIIGNQPAMAELSPQDAQNRFQMVFQRLLAVFARPEHPLALFLDDLQWLDAATLHLLHQLISGAEVRHLLLIGAFRDNEMSCSHPLMRTLAGLRGTGVPIHEVTLANLGLEDVTRLVVDALHCEAERARSLAQLVYEKTGGNPFFAIQFFAMLAEEGALTFNPEAAAWEWDVARIRDKGYTDNVVVLMGGKLRRFSAATQEALKQLACLGNVAATGTLTLVHWETEEAVHAALWEAVHAGLVSRLDNAYRFPHDRIQQAAYSLIPEEHRAEVHLRIGRVLLASMGADELAEHLFDVANQLNQGAARLVDRAEKAQVATINLRTGLKAKASAAFASACVYFAAGMALLDETDWGSRYELMFRLWLERAECEFLTGHLDTAEQLLGALLNRNASKVDQAAVYRLKVQLHIVKGEYPQAVASALTCLRLFGIDLPAHPTWQQVEAEYEAVWRNLDGRPIEGLIDLPLMTDPELRAAIGMLSAMDAPAYFTDFHLCCLLRCRMVNVSVRHGTSDAATYGYVSFGLILGLNFHRYREGYRFAKLACDVVEKHGFISYQAKIYQMMGVVAFWTQPISTVIDFIRAAFRVATETGDLTYACYCMDQSVTTLLVRGDALDGVWRESERSLDFVRKARFRDVADLIVSQQRFIATMQGRTATFSTFSDGQFDEARFEARLTGDRMRAMVGFYWVLKLKARFLSGDYAEALAAATKAKALLWTSSAHSGANFELLDYFFYTALTVAALYQHGSADARQAWHSLLTVHRDQLGEWAANCPPIFADKHALLVAEIARLEGRDLEAMRLYEEAIREARKNGFVQNEGVANELAAQFYLERGIEKVAQSYLREARYCYLCWGATGKVQQLDQRYPAIGEQAFPRTTTTIGTSVEQLDLATVMKASQAVSGEIVLENLIKTLMTIAVEHAGAERGLLILQDGEALRIAAEARTGRDGVTVLYRELPATSAELPESILRYVVRSRKSVILDDALAPNQFSNDDYVHRKRPRSVLCLALVKQAQLIGALYLENDLTPRVFTSARFAVLDLLGSQAAISLENARLYADLQKENAERKRAEEEMQRQKAHLDELFELAPESIVLLDADNAISRVNCEFTRVFGYSPEEALGRKLQDLVLPDDQRPGFDENASRIAAAQRVDSEMVRKRKNGERLDVSIVAAPVPLSDGQISTYVIYRDITGRKEAEKELRRSEADLRKAQAELAHVTRVTTMGELAASIAHEVNQPIAGVVINATACMRWLARVREESVNLAEAREALQRIIRDGSRAGEVIARIRALFKKTEAAKEPLDLNEVIREVVALARSEMEKRRVILGLELTPDLPAVLGDRVQLQQVMLNLILNAIEAMDAVEGRSRELVVGTQVRGQTEVRVTVRDSGPGLDAASLEKAFTAFHTTKPGGLGMGLSISRSIVENHAGRLWAIRNEGPGTTFQFTLSAGGW
ncbi:MAG TPA: AAA family ATPase [Chthoniobacterales bacterium]